jgi:hypothetical protein
VLDGAASRFINTGSEVYSNELVKTGDKGIARLVFLDRTDLVVGPRSEVKLDKFVYDPEGDSGAFATNVTRGAFRFVTGNQNHSNYSIATPHATLGVRGTIFELIITSDRTDVHLVNGALEVRSSTNQTVVLTANGINSVTVTATGELSAFTVPANITILSFSMAALGAAGTADTLGSGGDATRFGWWCPSARIVRTCSRPATPLERRLGSDESRERPVKPAAYQPTHVSLPLGQASDEAARYGRRLHSRMKR